MLRYDECITKLTPFLKMSGWAVGGDDVIFIPISGLGGINLKDRIPSGVCPFYDGPSLIELLDTIKQPARYFEMPFRMPIHDKYKDMGTMILGKVKRSFVQHHLCIKCAFFHGRLRWRVACAGRSSSCRLCQTSALSVAAVHLSIALNVTRHDLQIVPNTHETETELKLTLYQYY